MENTTTFRDRPDNLDEGGKRKWINARQPKGKWYFRRGVVAYTFLLFLILAPVLKINGNPVMLLDIINRKFYLFGQAVWAQDTYILALIMSVIVISVVLFTAVFGRVFCGWVCPQTIFLEMIYRRIEYFIEGIPGTKRTDIHSSQFKIRRFIKHLIFLLVSIFFTNILLLWFIGPDALMKIITEPVSQHITGFSVMILISLIYLFIYSYFREQVCTLVCPYGRMQGVLLDSRSISVIYDFKRGEPRNPKVNEGGDCINCHRCIAVCPTGIDIKNGSQLECIHCAACIDECNTVMKKIKKPLNLIRYDSLQGIETGKRNLFNGRAIGYTTVLIILFLIMVITISRRDPVDTTLWRVQGTLYQQLEAETYSNIFNIMMINKSSEEKNINLKLMSPSGEITVAGNDLLLKKDGKIQAILIIKLKKDIMSGKSTELKIGLYDKEQLLETITTNFLGP